MRERGLTLQSIADHLGCNLSTVWKWLRADRAKRARPDMVLRAAIEAAYGIPRDAWLTPAERRALARVSSLCCTGTDDL